MLDLHSLIWGFGESCTIVHCITSPRADVSLMMLHLNFHQPFRPTVWVVIYLLPFLSYLAGSKRASAIRPGYGDNYRSRSHRFVERQKGNRLFVLLGG